MNKQRLAILCVLMAAVIGFFVADGASYLSLEYAQSIYASTSQFVAAHWLWASGIYIAVYFSVAALMLPGALILTLCGGALFGLFWGAIWVSIASTTAAIASAALSRYLFRDTLKKKYQRIFTRIDAGIAREGAYYLLFLRLVPFFPYFVVNLCLGLTNMSLRTYGLVSWIGMLPATIIYVNAGRAFSSLDSLSGLVSADIVGALVLLGIFPLVAKFALGVWRNKQQLKGFKKPRNFDYNLGILGAGSGGLVSASIAAQAGAKVLLIERDAMGGDCLNTGCVPSKALINASVSASVNSAQNLRAMGKGAARASQDAFSEAMSAVRTSIEAIAPHDSEERFRGLGVEVIKGDGKLSSPWHLEVDGEVHSCQSIIIATGATPSIPPIAGIEQVDYLTSDTFWDLQDIPQSLAIVGGGAIGCELAQAMARLGCQVTIVEFAPCLLPAEDAVVGTALVTAMQALGVHLYLGSAVQKVQIVDGQSELTLSTGETVVAEKMLISTGRKPRVQGFGLEEAGIQLTQGGAVEVDEKMRTNISHIFAVGDVTNIMPLTHVSGHQAGYATINALAAGLYSATCRYDVIPRVTFTVPQVASVGINERSAAAMYPDFKTYEYSFKELDRAIIDGETTSFIKVITDGTSDKLLGVCIVAKNAGDLLTSYTFAMQHNLGLKAMASVCQAYPTAGEAIRALALQYQKSKAPYWLLPYSQKWFAWLRSS